MTHIQTLKTLEINGEPAIKHFEVTTKTDQYLLKGAAWNGLEVIVHLGEFVAGATFCAITQSIGDVMGKHALSLENSFQSYIDPNRVYPKSWDVISFSVVGSTKISTYIGTALVGAAVCLLFEQMANRCRNYANYHFAPNVEIKEVPSQSSAPQVTVSQEIPTA